MGYLKHQWKLCGLIGLKDHRIELEKMHNYIGEDSQRGAAPNSVSNLYLNVWLIPDRIYQLPSPYINHLTMSGSKKGKLNVLQSQMLHVWELSHWTKIQYIVAVQSLSCVWLFVNPWIAAHQASLSFSMSWSLLKLMSILSTMPSNHLILYLPLLLLPSVLSSIRVFSKESDWKRLCISFSISPSNEYSGWISFRFDWFDLLTIQRTLKSL